MKKMKKISKGFLTFALCMVIMLTMFIPSQSVKAKSNEEKNSSTPFINSELVTGLSKKYSSNAIAIDNDTVFIKLSYEDNIKSISENKNLDYSQAEKLVKEKDNKIPKTSKITDSIKRAGENEAYSSIPGAAYEDITGMILKRFYVVSAASTTCTVVATINVKLRVYWQYANTREFLEVYDKNIVMEESGVWDWKPSTISAPIMSNGNINLDASGIIEGTISWSLQGTYKAAGFSVGSNYYARKFQTISYVFNPDYIGGILY